MERDPHSEQNASQSYSRDSDFQKYFELGEDESASPFLNRIGKSISRNIHLKSAICSSFFLLLAFIFSLDRDSIFASFAAIPLAFVYFISGTPAFISAMEDIFVQKDVNIDVLMAFSGFAAIIIGHPYEGALLFVLFALSESLEEMVTLKAKRSLLSIYEMAPTKASIIQSNHTTSEKSVYDIEIGTQILVRCGEIVPLDGIVVSGSGSFSASHVTGESRIQEVEIGEKMVSGCRITQGSIGVQVTAKQADSTVAKIIRLITEAEESKPKYALTFEKFGRVYSLSVITVTFLLPILLPMLFKIPLQGEEGAFVRAISFLITASPCALFIAVPIAYLSSLSASVASGAILKGGNVFDQLNRCSTVVFDKTGTLTKGILEFRQFFEIERTGNDPFIRAITETDVLSIAASVEQHVVHPIAKAIVSCAQKRGLSLSKASSIRVSAGVGVSAYVDVGLNSFYVEVRAPTKVEEEEMRSALQKKNGSTLAGPFALISIQKEGLGQAIFLLTFEDFVRDESLETVSFLQRSGKEVVMLSGDHAIVAKQAAESLGITRWQGDLRPDDKLQIITELTQAGLKGLVMVGDGINDAPSLVRADVGISMGKFSSATARDVADIVLLNDNLSLIPALFKKAKKTQTIVFQNLFLAFCSIGIGTISSLFGCIPLWAAVLLHEGATLIVGLNALRLLQRI